jgi:hypothetical protein
MDGSRSSLSAWSPPCGLQIESILFGLSCWGNLRFTPVTVVSNFDAFTLLRPLLIPFLKWLPTLAFLNLLLWLLV